MSKYILLLVASVFLTCQRGCGIKSKNSQDLQLLNSASQLETQKSSDQSLLLDEGKEENSFVQADANGEGSFLQLKGSVLEPRSLFEPSLEDRKVEVRNELMGLFRYTSNDADEALHKLLVLEGTGIREARDMLELLRDMTLNMAKSYGRQEAHHVMPAEFKNRLRKSMESLVFHLPDIPTDLLKRYSIEVPQASRGRSPSPDRSPDRTPVTQPLKLDKWIASVVGRYEKPPTPPTPPRPCTTDQDCAALGLEILTDCAEVEAQDRIEVLEKRKKFLTELESYGATGMKELINRKQQGDVQAEEILNGFLSELKQL